MMKGMTLWGFLALALAGGCEAGLFPLAGEKALDPEITPPTVNRFAQLTGVGIQWPSDDLASRYVLYRQLVTSGTVTSVYQGTGTSYFDSTALEQTQYLYYLAKVRGTKEFPLSTGVLGAFDSVNTRSDAAGTGPDTAVPFVDTSLGTIFAYSDTVAAKTYSEETRDWYYYDLGPQRTLTVYVVYTGLGALNNTAYLIFNGGSDVPEVNNGEIGISNPNFVTTRLYFSLRSNPSVNAAPGIYKVPYKLKFLKIS